MDPSLKCMECPDAETCEVLAWLVEDFDDLAELEMMAELKCPKKEENDETH